jgi:DNA-directed RNA polymerase subunit N (RpoN/RPB10)
MRINCLTCGHMVDLGDNYDDYEGPVKCFVCSTTLKIHTAEGKLKTLKLVKDDVQPSPVAKAVGMSAHG